MTSERCVRCLVWRHSRSVKKDPWKDAIWSCAVNNSHSSACQCLLFPPVRHNTHLRHDNTLVAIEFNRLFLLRFKEFCTTDANREFWQQLSFEMRRWGPNKAETPAAQVNSEHKNVVLRTCVSFCWTTLKNCAPPCFDHPVEYFYLSSLRAPSKRPEREEAKERWKLTSDSITITTMVTRGRPRTKNSNFKLHNAPLAVHTFTRRQDVTLSETKPRLFDKIREGHSFQLVVTTFLIK